ncbi:hypothetical protein [Brevundimonas sp. Root1423]|uniref:hypothetical protein n=1 Tax=Brevundimonas sp. Root1423 TaxID=1736462 RepID=UPI000A60C1D1|nr:hypothetical protein [Brevundimonas sp. Root1423]
MQLYLETLRSGGPVYSVEPTARGFSITRRQTADPADFNWLASGVMEAAGEAFVALPELDQDSNYFRVHITVCEKDPSSLHDAHDDLP